MSTAVERLRESVRSWDAEQARGFAVGDGRLPTPTDLRELLADRDLLAQRVERLEKAIREALELHVEEDGFCMACTTGWECRTHRILTEGAAL